MAVRVSPRAARVIKAQADLKLEILRLAETKELTDVELLQALNELEATTLKYMLRYERHGDIETPAGIEKESTDG